MLLIEAVCKSIPKTVLFTLIFAQSELDTNAVVGLTISLVLALVNALRAYNLYLTELRRELARVKPPSAGDGPPPADLALKQVLEEIVDSEDELGRDAILAIWRNHESTPAHDDDARTDFLETQLSLLLADTVCFEERESMFQITSVVTSIVITLSDTASDINVTALYLQEGSEFGLPLLIHLIVALVCARARLRGSRPAIAAPAAACASGSAAGSLPVVPGAACSVGRCHASSVSILT